MGRLMMLDELHDPDPPQPGMREFAIVAERAQEIRRRRATWATRLASVVLVIGAGLAVYEVSSRGENTAADPPVTTADPTPTETTAPSATASNVPSTLSLDDAQSASALPPIALGPGLLTISEQPLVQILESTDGATCVRAEVDVSTPTCAPAGTGIFVIGYGDNDAERVAVIVDPTVNVSVDTSGTTCTQGFPDFAIVQVLVCAGVDLDTASIEFESADHLVIHP